MLSFLTSASLLFVYVLPVVVCFGVAMTEYLLDTEFEAGLPVIMCPVHKILDITFVPLPITSRIAVGVRCDEEWGQPATKLSLATEPNLAILQLSADEVCKTYWQPQLKPKNCSNFALTTELYV